MSHFFCRLRLRKEPRGGTPLIGGGGGGAESHIIHPFSPYMVFIE